MCTQFVYVKISTWLQFMFIYLFNSAALGRVCMKLVIVMGVTWLFDVLSWAHNVYIAEVNGTKHSTNSLTHDIRYYFWYVTDAINALQGVLIFLVVASQPQVRLFSLILLFFFRFLSLYLCHVNILSNTHLNRFTRRLQDFSHQKVAAPSWTSQMASIIQAHRMD